MMDLITRLVRRVRQNHGLEHATIHMLAGKARGRVSGLSDPWGFTLFGDISQPQVMRAASDALVALAGGREQSGDSPELWHESGGEGDARCRGRAAGAGGQARCARSILRATIIFILPALVVGDPVAFRVQEFTTTADVADRWIVTVRRMTLGPIVLNRVTTGV